MNDRTDTDIEAELKAAWLEWTKGDKSKPSRELVALSKQKDVQDWLQRHTQLKEMVQTDSPELLDTLAKSEMVHPVDGIEGIKTRLAPTHGEYDQSNPNQGFYFKHAYGLFLPWDQEHPMCAVYTAWKNNDKNVDEIPNQISELKGLPSGRLVKDPRYMLFYSISNMSGGIGKVGPMLLGKLANGISGETPDSAVPVLGKIEMSTLSPVRTDLIKGCNFLGWLEKELSVRKAEELFTPEEIEKVKAISGMPPNEWLRKLLPIGDEYDRDAVLGLGEDKSLFDQLRRDLALDYLARGKWEGRDKQPFDLVEHFHLSNGAFIGSVSLQTDDAEWERSGGVMVNYYYGNKQELRDERKTSYREGGVVHMTPELEQQYVKRKLEIVEGLQEGIEKNQVLKPLTTIKVAERPVPLAEVAMAAVEKS